MCQKSSIGVGNSILQIRSLTTQIRRMNYQSWTTDGHIAHCYHVHSRLSRSTCSMHGNKTRRTAYDRYNSAETMAKSTAIVPAQTTQITYSAGAKRRWDCERYREGARFRDSIFRTNLQTMRCAERCSRRSNWRCARIGCDCKPGG